MTDDRNPRVETPRHEPEILPPTHSDDGSRDWRGQSARIEIVRISGWRLLLMGLLGLAIIAGVLFVFAGALLIAVPVLAAMMAMAWVAAWWKRTLR